MGEVAISFEIMPEGIETGLGEMKNAIESSIGDICSIQNTEEKPIAFGLKALMMVVVVQDEDGIMDKLESSICSISGVQNAKVVTLTKL